jgi:hypothetical protein
VAFFEGNDLSDVMTASSREFTLPDIARRTFAPYDPNNPIWKSNNTGPFPLPIRFQINGETHQMAFLDSYLSWLNAEREVFASSENMAKMGQVWNDMASAAGDNTCLAIACLQFAAHLCVHRADDRHRMMLQSDDAWIAGSAIRENNASIRFNWPWRCDSQRDAVRGQPPSRTPVHRPGSSLPQAAAQVKSCTHVAPTLTSRTSPG